MKRPKLPPVMVFERIKRRLPGSTNVMFDARCFFDIVEYRNPRRGEWFASGAVPQAYLARNDISMPYWIVRPTHFAERRTIDVRGDPVPLGG